VASSQVRTPLRVVILAPPYVELPPARYGGTEAVCAGLADALLERGHDVTVVGAGRRRISSRFVATRPEPQPERMGQLMPDVLHAAAAARLLGEIRPDVVHDHTLAGLLSAGSRVAPTVATMHAPMQGEMLQLARAVAPTVRLVAISHSQRRQARELPWVGMVHNAVRVRDFPFLRSKQPYALFMGRVCPEKGLPTAITAARAAGIPLLIAAKCTEPTEREYFERRVRPALGAGATWLGEVGGERKLQLLAGARCLLFPIDWEEPFGMVLIEALACGTPVVALRRGAVPEVVTHGLTGLLAEQPDQLPDLLHEVGRIDPGACRAEAERRFDVARMAADYEAVYERVLERSAPVGRAARAPEGTAARHLRDRGAARPAPLEGRASPVGYPW